MTSSVCQLTAKAVCGRLLVYSQCQNPVRDDVEHNIPVEDSGRDFSAGVDRRPHDHWCRQVEDSSGSAPDMETSSGEASLVRYPGRGSSDSSRGCCSPFFASVALGSAPLESRSEHLADFESSIRCFFLSMWVSSRNRIPMMRPKHRAKALNRLGSRYGNRSQMLPGGKMAG